jgi:hypothetical protein
MSDDDLRLADFVDGPSVGAGVLALGKEEAAGRKSGQTGDHPVPEITLRSRLHCCHSQLKG